MLELLADMMLTSPSFKDKTGYLPEQNIDTEFLALNEGLEALRRKLGEENYDKLVALSAKMRIHFDADPEDKTKDGIKGRDCILEMEDILKASARRKAP